MKVTPTKKKFGKYKPGDVFDFPDKAAKLFIKIGKLAGVVEAASLTQASQTYSTRMMQAEPAAPATVTRPVTQSEKPQVFPGAIIQSAEAPYGYKADGTPRKRPGRPASAE